MGRMGEAVGEVFSDDAVVAAGEVLFDEGERTVAQVATAMDGATTAIVAYEVQAYTDAFAASVFNHANLSAANAALIFEHVSMTAARAALIFEHANMAAARAGAIFSHANLSDAKAVSIYEHANLSDAKAASIADSITSAKILSMLNTASFTDADRIAALLDGTLLVVADASTQINTGVYADALYADAFESTYLAVVRAYNLLIHANLTADRTQTVIYTMEMVAKLVDILTYGAGDLTVAGATTINGVNRYETLTVNGGITLTLGTRPSALIVGTIANSGNIVKTKDGGAAGTRAQPGAGEGGQGAGGFMIFADVLGSSGIISADGEAGENGTTVDANGSGGNGGAGAFHRVAANVPGTGGNGAYQSTAPALRGDGGVDGGGGGAHVIAPQAGGDGGGSVLTTRASYAVLATEIRQAAIDWVIVNVFGKVPGATVSIPDFYGSGGGGGAARDSQGAEGGGGGGGGEVLALCFTLNNTGTVRANAGVGGDGGTEGIQDNEGGGGGGGLVYVLYVALTAAGTFQALGAAAGAGDSADTAGQAGGNGVATSQAV